jgi:hypothetical protein
MDAVLQAEHPALKTSPVLQLFLEVWLTPRLAFLSAALNLNRCFPILLSRIWSRSEHRASPHGTAQGSEIEWRTEVDRVSSHDKNPSNKINETIRFFKVGARFL